MAVVVSISPSVGFRKANLWFYLDTPLAVPRQVRHEPIRYAFPDGITTWANLRDPIVAVQIDDGGDLYVGLKFIEVRTSEVLLAQCIAGITLWTRRTWPALHRAGWLGDTQTLLSEHLRERWPAAGIWVEVCRDSNFDSENPSRAARAATCHLSVSGSGFQIPLMGQLFCKLVRRLECGGKVHSPDWHLRF